MNKVYIGVDFHARQQTICYLTTETGELATIELKHQDKTAVRTFYEQFSGQVIVGLEASGYSPWFERLLEEFGSPSLARRCHRDPAPGSLATERSPRCLKSQQLNHDTASLPDVRRRLAPP